MSGSPNRPGRDAFGQEYEDSTPIRDPRKQIGATQMNLSFWQIAGAGLIMPRARLHFAGSATPTILNRAEAWNPRQLSTGQFIDPTFVSVATGDYLIEYESPIPDELGVDQAISFESALAYPAAEDSAVLQFAKASVISTDRKRVRVTTYNAAGAATHMDVVVLLW